MKITNSLIILSAIALSLKFFGFNFATYTYINAATPAALAICCIIIDKIFDIALAEEDSKSDEDEISLWKAILLLALPFCLLFIFFNTFEFISPVTGLILSTIVYMVIILLEHRTDKTIENP